MATYKVDRDKNKLLIAPQREDDFTTLMQLPSRRWMKRAHMFIVPATRVNCAHLLASPLLGEIQGEALQYIQEHASTQAGNRPFPKWYTFKTNPFPDQFNAIHKCYRNNTWALFMRMGSGKSKAAIDLATAAFYEQLIEGVILICPNAVKPVWLADHGQIIEHSPCPTLRVNVEADFDASMVPVKRDRLTWCVVGVEAFSQGKTFDRVLPWARHHRVAVIVDESSRIKTPSTIRTEKIVELGREAQMRGIMTGTAVTRLIMDLFSQFEFLDPNIIGAGDFYAFRNRYAIMGGFKNKKVVGYDHVDELFSLVEPYVYICDKPKGLPQKIFAPPRTVQLSAEQKDKYRELKKGEVKEVSVANILNKMAKLQEIVGGFLREDPIRTLDPLTGRERRTQGKIIWELPDDKNPKLIELHNYVEEAGDEPIIVWAKYRWELTRIQRALSQHGVCETLHGGVPDDMTEEGRTARIRRFQQGEARYMAATQQVGGIGHTMTAAHLMLYYSNTQSLEDRLQSEDRIHRIGQEDDCVYTDLIAEKTVDIPILESIKDKKTLDEYVREKLMAASNALTELLGDP